MQNEQPNPAIGTLCSSCGQVVLTAENLARSDPRTGAGVCQSCAPKGQIPPGMLGES